ncbi:MAG: helix-hairpin-helix domain-containing protein [Chlorobi bacterium]|nr:helix-hairpin-helix domain-containing protein [Chlorobiota bacterium]
MKHSRITICFITFLILFQFALQKVFAYSGNDNYVFPLNKKYFILEKEENNYQGFTILHKADTSEIKVKIINNLLQNSFAAQSVKLYYYAQNYLKNTGQIETIEPVFLLLSGNKGGYTRKGFYLRKANEKINKSEVYYIDFSKENDNEENYLGSFSQIFPHEMGHVIYRLLTRKFKKDLPKGVDIHFSSIITDFRTAFDEGFALHFENIAFEHEQNLSLKKAIEKDFILKKEVVERFSAGYLRDFYLPFRLDYYRITPIVWYDIFENIKHIEWINNNLYKHKTKTFKIRNAERAIFLRNSGVNPDLTEFKNYQQALSTEGVIGSFFNDLLNSKLANNYEDFCFYKDFLNKIPNDTTPEKLFTPLENEYLKVFYVFNKYLDSISLNHSPLITFMQGYLCEFPIEKGVVMRLFEEATGYYFTKNTGPEIWLLNKEYKHGILLYDQFGGNKVDFYSFNINAADREDLLTIKGLKNNEIESILKYRDSKGFFTSLSNLDSIKGLSEMNKEAILSCSFDQNFINTNKKELKLYKLIFSGLTRLFEKGLFYLFIFITFYYLLFYGKKHVMKIFTVKYVIRKIIKLYFLVFLGFLSVLLANEPLQLFLIISVVFVTIEFLLLKRERNKRDAFHTSFFIIVMIMFSVW